MEAKKLTPVQIELLRMFSFDHSDEFAKEIKEVLGYYLRRKLDDELDKLWDNGTLDQEKLDQIRKEDLHQTLRQPGSSCC